MSRVSRRVEERGRLIGVVTNNMDSDYVVSRASWGNDWCNAVE